MMSDIWNGAVMVRLIPRKRPQPSKLGMFEEIPYDVFFEILVYLNPLQLLQLAMVSKEMRCVLRSDEANYVWKQVGRCTFSRPVGI